MPPSTLTDSTRSPAPADFKAGRQERLITPAREPAQIETASAVLGDLPLSVGALVGQDGVGYRIWAPDHTALEVVITPQEGSERVLQTVRGDNGYHQVQDPAGRAGDCYLYKLADGSLLPDPASRCQIHGQRGCSTVVDPSAYVWRDRDWRRPAFRDLIVYETHVGTFTEEGTFRAMIGRLPHLRKFGINSIEIMPVAQFPGGRNWGYDGTFIYAPASAYGTPDDLRALVDAAHAQGIAVILDVVYNHTGPDGSTLAAFASAYFNQAKPTPWGSSFNFDGPGSEAVRDYFAGNALYWMRDFHIDGLRLDATHAISDESDRHILAEISARVHALGGYVIAEDERNLARLIEPQEQGGYDFDAVWADDFHHTVRVGLTREQHAYLQNFSGSLEETVDTLKHGWRFRGQLLVPGSEQRGTEVNHMPPSRLVHCISNHDQAGNRAFGERVAASIPAESYRAISMLLCLTPYTPMIFMGQEWAATTPFLYFTDHEPELGRLVTEGRRREFVGFPEFNDPATLDRIPDPQKEDTFLQSKLNWKEVEAPAHAGVLALYRRCLEWRLTQSAFRPDTREQWDVGVLQGGVGYLRLDDEVSSYLLIFHLWPEEDLTELDLDKLPWPSQGRPCELLMSSNDEDFGGPGCPLRNGDRSYLLGGAETLLMRAPPG